MSVNDDSEYLLEKLRNYELSEIEFDELYFADQED